MEERNIYQDIAQRTNGDIYIGVVGPVRTGKSTFIKRFMDTIVIPNIDDRSRRERAVDELPQSAAGRTIMTTEPKFIPEEAVGLAAVVKEQSQAKDHIRGARFQGPQGMFPHVAVVVGAVLLEARHGGQFR